MSSIADNHSTQLKQALLALKEMRSKLEAEKQAKTEPIAIVGIGCRFPGDASSPEDFWRLLHDGADLVTEIPANRWDVDAYYDSDPEVEGKIYTRQGYFLSEVEKFDASFFGITPREALTLDPQQRLLLEVCWEALENACQPPDLLRNSQTGIFMGVMHNDYSRRLAALSDTYLNPYYGTGNGSSFLAGRLSYFLGLHGPSMVVDTACSSSLLSVHLACQSLRLKECRLALAGGVNLILHPEASIVLSRMRALSVDGRCKTFDAKADGYARGEGCGVVVLKRLSDAQKNGDRIFAIIRGSAINHDGPSSGLTVPSGLAQQALLQQALENAGVKPNQISYVEAHGTGTSLGDPIEVQALATVYGQERLPSQPLHIASVKTNVGHLESAAGICGLIKVALALQHKQIPPHLHLQTVNPHIDLESNPIRIPTQLIPWDSIEGRRLAGVSSFGLSGLNAHLVLEESPITEEKSLQNQRSLHLFTLSAKTQPALEQLINNSIKYIQEHLDMPVADICASANRGRSHFSQRLALIIESTKDLYEQLQSLVTENSSRAHIISTQKTPKVTFLFTGQGSQYVRMGQQLYQTQPLFRQILDKCDEILRPYLERSLLDVLFPQSGDVSVIDETAYTQPSLFAIEYALAQLWMSWGIQPNVLMGHSVGEYVAACIAGVFSLEDGLKLIANRARLMQALPRNGQMAAVFASAEQVKSIIAPYEQVAIAAANGPTNIVISGETTAINQVLQTLEAKEIKYQLLRVSHAFHSPLMEPMLNEFRQVASEVTYHPPQIAIISNLTGQFASFTDIGQPDYWCQHIREAVLFSTGIETLYKNGYQVFVEVGPRPILTGMGQRCLSANDVTWLSSLNIGGSDWQYLLNSLSQLYLQGAEINWQNFESGYGQHHISLPTYPFQRETFWSQKPERKLTKASFNQNISKIPASILGQEFHSPLSSNIHFQTKLNLGTFSCLADHVIYDTTVVPGAFYLSMFLAAALEVFSDSSPVAIEDVSFLQALIIATNEEPTVQIVLTPLETGVMSCQLFSLAQAQTKETSASWVLHAQGKLSRINSLPETVSLDEIKAKCLEYSPTSSSIYQAANQRGLMLGSSFEWLGALWQTEGLALSQIQTPSDVSDIDIYPLHPGLIDSCFQLLSATLANHHQELGNYIPIGIEQIRVKKLPIATQLQSFAQLRSPKSLPSRMLVGDIQLLDEMGQVCVSIQGLQIKSVSKEAMLPPQSNNWHKWLYEIQWQHQQNLAANQLTKVSQWLIFADSQGFATSLADTLRQQGQICNLVFPGDKYQLSQTGNYSINPNIVEDFQTILEHLENIAPVDNIIYLWGLEKSLHEETTSQELEEAQALTCGGVLHIVQTIAKAKLISLPKLWIVTKEAQAVGKVESLAVEQATLWGLGRVVALEHPEIWGGLIDLDTQTTVEELVTSIAELIQDNSENLVALRNSQKYVARLQQKQPLKTPASLSINQDATYLITGGLGALGLKVAANMAECGARHLVLTSRRQIDTQTQEHLNRIEAMGTRVITISADITEPNDVKNLLENIQNKLPSLRGIIHAAGVLSDSILIKQDWSGFARVMAPKVKGAWNLHTQTLDLPLDFFVLFSSAASLIGSVGQSNYAASNAFLDALAHYRQVQGLPGLSINWGAWGEVGMASTISHQVQERWNTIGVGEISPLEGLNALGYLLQSQNVQVGVLPIEWTKFLQQFPNDATPAFFTEIGKTTKLTKTHTSGLLSQLKEATQNQRLVILTEYIRNEVAQVMGLSSSTILQQQQGLFEMGMDSLMVVELKNRLQKTIEHPLPATLVFEYSTVEALTNYIAQQVFGWQQSTVSDVELPTKDEENQKLLSELEELSEDDAEILLAEKLAALETKISLYE